MAAICRRRRLTFRPSSALEEIARYPYGAISQLRAEYRLSLAGGQEKIALFHDDRAPLAKGWFAPLAGAPSSHIIKPQATDRFPLLALNEFMCMEAARAMGFEVPDTALVPGEHPLFVVRRYDRERAGDSATARSRCCGGCTRRTFAKLSAALRERSTRHEKPITLRIWPPFWWAMLHDPLRRSANCSRRIALNYLIGNCDAHLKNYSLLLREGAAVSLAPVYDLVCTAIYDGRFGGGLSRSMGIRIGDHLNIDRVTPSDFLLLARDMRQPKRVAANDS